MSAYQQQYFQIASGNRQYDTELRGLADFYTRPGELRCPLG
jgi:hypothetical protein